VSTGGGARAGQADVRHGCASKKWCCSPPAFAESNAWPGLGVSLSDVSSSSCTPALPAPRRQLRRRRADQRRRPDCVLQHAGRPHRNQLPGQPARDPLGAVRHHRGRALRGPGASRGGAACARGSARRRCRALPAAPGAHAPPTAAARGRRATAARGRRLSCAVPCSAAPGQVSLPCAGLTALLEGAPPACGQAQAGPGSLMMGRRPLTHHSDHTVLVRPSSRPAVSALFLSNLEAFPLGLGGFT
jgi:hypothetical protein